MANPTAPVTEQAGSTASDTPDTPSDTPEIKPAEKKPSGKPSGPSLADVKSNPGLAPEAMVRGEALHKASTDRTAADLVDEGTGARDVWVIEGTILVRADDEDAARSKFAAALGVAFDTRDIKVRNAKPKDLLTP